jgi:chromosome segregation ATPase
MGTVFLILILAGAVLALVAALVAWRAYLRLRRARAALQNNLTEEVDRLSRRTGELEENLSALDARAQQLPVQIAELQQSLSTLRVLTEALAATLRQAQRVLSYSALKTLSSSRIADLLRYRPVPKNDPRSG